MYMWTLFVTCALGPRLTREFEYARGVSLARRVHVHGRARGTIAHLVQMRVLLQVVEAVRVQVVGEHLHKRGGGF